MKYYQCRFEQETPDGLKVTVGYIEERGAKFGALVELKGEEGLWRVTSVGQPPVEYDELKNKQGMDRRSLLSIK